MVHKIKSDKEEKKYRTWFIIRDGGFSSQEAIKDILNNFKIDDYKTEPSFVAVYKFFSDKNEAKKFNKLMADKLWNFGWYKQVDCSASGIESKDVIAGKEDWCEIEDDE